ncbi:MAG: hypothetical protein KBD64_05360 [Gammaproteobacteria bacterium]|nr:hypothetical protein [Gammaproteobacteria bacterium]
MPFSQPFLDEISRLTHLEIFPMVEDPEILIDLINALGQDDIVPVYDENIRTILSPRHIALIRCLGDFTEQDIDAFRAQGGVTHEIEELLCNTFIEAWLEARAPINLIFQNLYTPLGVATRYGKLKYIDLLIEAGATVCGKYRYSRSHRNLLPYSIITIALASYDSITAEYLIGMGCRIPRWIRNHVAQRVEQEQAEGEENVEVRETWELILSTERCRNVAFTLVTTKVTHNILRRATREELFNHFCILFHYRSELMNYQALVGREVFQRFILILAYIHPLQIGDYILNAYTAAVTIPLEQETHDDVSQPSAHVTPAPSPTPPTDAASPSPVPATPLLFLRSSERETSASPDHP